jgi:ring-1,2-phenylacetyl-CoA epoxidase subunit PaaB
MNSLDPRVNRLPSIGIPGPIQPKAALDQWGTFEVFVQPKEGKSFQHEGIVHAPDLELSYILAKETFTRRFTCVSLFVADTRHVYVSPTTEGNRSVADVLPAMQQTSGEDFSFEVFMLPKRGKQHIHIGAVMAGLPQEAMRKAIENNLHQGKVIFNLWVVRNKDIRFTSPEEKELWITLPEKKFRDAAEYKGGEKLKAFLEKHAL